MNTLQDYFNELKNLKDEYSRIIVGIDNNTRHRDAVLHSKARNCYLDLSELQKKVYRYEVRIKEQFEEINRRLDVETREEELIKRLAEVEAREEMVGIRECKVAGREDAVNKRLDTLKDYYDDCIAIVTEEVTKVKDEMVAVYCEKLEEVEELLEVVRTTNMPQFRLELFEQLRDVSPFEYSANSIEGVCSEDTELDLGQYTAMVVPNPVVIKVSSVTASPRKQATTRAKYSIEDIPVYKARVAELKALRDVPWKEWVKTDEGKEHQRLTAAIRRLEKNIINNV